MVNIHTDLCNWHCSSGLSQLLCLQGSYFIAESVGASPVLPVSRCQGRNLAETSYSIIMDNPWYPAQGPCVQLLRKAATEVLKPRSEQGLRGIDKDQSEESEDRALLNICYHIFVHKGKSTTIVSQNQTLGFCTRVWLCKTTITKHLVMSQQQYYAWIQKHDGGQCHICS